MRTLKQFVIRFGTKNEAEAEELPRELMPWLRERQVESQYSLDDIRPKLAADTHSLFDPADLELFLASDNPWFYDYLVVLSVLGESLLLEVLGIIGGRPEDAFKLPAHLRKQIRRGYEIGGTGFIDDCEDGSSAELN